MAPTSREQATRVEAESSLFERLYESLPDGVVLANANGEILRVNSQVEKLFGYNRSELLGKPVEILIPERFRAVHVGQRNAYCRDPHMRPMGAGLELYGRRKDDTELPVDIMLSPVETDEGARVIAVVRDITQRRRADDALRQSEERLRSVVESVKDYAIFTLDQEGRVTSWSPAAERIKGYRADEIIGQRFSCFYAPADIERGKPERELRQAAQHGRVEDEGWRVRKDGSQFWANVVITALRDRAGNLQGFSKVTRDFTARKRAEEALLLEITNVLLSNLDIRKLLAAVSASIRQVAPHEYASLALYDPELKRLRVQVLDSPAGMDLRAEERFISLEGAPAGVCFSSRQPLVVDRLDDGRFEIERIQHLLSAGMKSGCWLPLISHGRPMGTLEVASTKEAAFAGANLNLLSQVTNQIALAVDNAAAFSQITSLNERLQEEKRYLEDELRTEYNFEEIIGESRELKHVLKQVETVAPTDATVLILGETGTGKELIARAIHNLSGRRERTFVKLNCAAIPSGLLESEIFGHEKGAFTGAISQKIGRLELAHRGTFFLDEVGDIPLELQPKLLRALQEKEFERLGSTRTIPVDVRLIAATNRELAQMVKDRQFRSDLYYRLRVFPVELAPLRGRTGDIPILVHHFIEKHARRMNKHIDTIPGEVMQALEQWRWPGNIRELENFIERAVILSPGPVLRVPLSELAMFEALPAPSAELSTLEAAERAHILHALREAGGVIAGHNGAAARLGLKRTTLNAKMRKLGITREDL
ncbi:MAG TPA: sigma 54-interacting transcriptional regulator [Terriglobia bacterium]|nr:sigma 54-interacting transcriptional regulator [Terriglobia bacterium]